MGDEGSQFWSSTFGVVVRWIALVPTALVLFWLAELIPLLLVSFLASLNAPTWAIIIIVLLGGSVFVYLLFMGAMMAPVLVGAIAPRVRIGVSVVGITYGLFQTVNVIDSVINLPWYITLVKVAVGITIIIGLVTAYSDANESE